MPRGRKGRSFDVIKGFCRVAAQWPDLIWAADGQAPMTPYKEFFSGWAKPFPAPTGHFIKVDGRFIKATKANGHVIKTNGRFIKRFINLETAELRSQFFFGSMIVPQEVFSARASSFSL